MTTGTGWGGRYVWVRAHTWLDPVMMVGFRLHCQAATFTTMKHRILLFATSLALASLGHAAHPAMPVIPDTVFKVTDYGAVGDGAKDNTTNLQAAINAASAAGGGMVEIPAGTFQSGPITLVSRINLHLDKDAVLQMLPFGVYPGGATNAQTFIVCRDGHDLEISGEGTIDGQGAAWWAAHNDKSTPDPVRPMLLNLYSCNRLFIHDVTYMNPPGHHCGLRGNGGNITISNLTINTVSPSPNTDGLNFVGTNSIIENCHIGDGDDNIAMGATGPINDLLITNCTFATGHGVSIGSGISVGISNLTVANCTFNGTKTGIRIKCMMGRSQPIWNVNYINLTMTNVDNPIIIYSYYNLVGTPDKITPTRALAASNTLPVTANTPRWSDITFSNLTVHSSRGRVAGVIWGPTEMPVSNVTFIHVTNNAPKPFLLYNVRGVKIIDCEFNAAGGDTLTLCNADVTLSNTVPVDRVVTLGGASSHNSLALYNASAALNSPDLLSVNPITIGGGVLTDAAGLTLPGSTRQNFALGTQPSTVVTTGDLTLNSTLNITTAAGFTATNYTLFRYAVSFSGMPTLGATPAGYTCTLNTNTSGKIMLQVYHE